MDCELDFSEWNVWWMVSDEIKSITDMIGIHVCDQEIHSKSRADEVVTYVFCNQFA